VWVAHTGVTQTSFKYPYGIWQYSHTGKINGINTNVDLNYGYIDYPKVMKTAGLNGFNNNDKVQIITHTVVKNDSLWAIADKYLGNSSRYPEIKALNNLKSDTIYPGQILKIPQKKMTAACSRKQIDRSISKGLQLAVEGLHLSRYCCL